MTYEYRPAKISEFVKAVSDFYKVDLFARSRTQMLVDIRHACYFVLRRRPITFQMIANAFGKNHATVIHGVQTASSLIDIGDFKMTSHVRSIEALAITFFNEKGMEMIDPLIREDAFKVRLYNFLEDNKELLPDLTHKYRISAYKRLTLEVYEKVFPKNEKNS